MKSAIPGTDDEIEVVDEKHGQYGRIRIREYQGGYNAVKCSIFLTADQLEEHAEECMRLAAIIWNRRP